jgi:hypothetical protein
MKRNEKEPSKAIHQQNMDDDYAGLSPKERISLLSDH